MQTEIRIYEVTKLNITAISTVIATVTCKHYPIACELAKQITSNSVFRAFVGPIGTPEKYEGGKIVALNSL